MKFFAVVLTFFSISAQAATHCFVNTEDKRHDMLGFVEVKDAKWDEKFANAYTLSDGEKGRFTLEVIMTSPDTGIEVITIEGMKPETCKSEFLFLKNADGQDVYSGVRETCEPSPQKSISVSCWF